MIQQKMSASHEKVIQGSQGVTKAMKGMAFGVLGMATAGAEFVGMMSMWKQTTTAVAEAQGEVDRALKESGKNSKDYKDSMNELSKANRWARMTFRNLMLSMFDMVPFFILTINGIVKLRAAYKALREAQLEQAAMSAVLKKANIGLAESGFLANTSYTNLTKTQRLLKAEQALMISSNQALMASNVGVAASNVSTNGSLITSIPLLNKQGAAMGKLSGIGSKLSGVFTGIGAAVGGFVTKIAKIAIPIVAIIALVEAWKNNWGGVGDVMNQIGVKIGNVHPILQKTMTLLAKVGSTIHELVHGNFTAAKELWVGGSKEMADATKEMSDKQKKALEEASQAIQEFKDESISALFEISEGDRGEQRDWLKSIGIHGDEKDKIKDALDVVEDIGTATQSLHDTLQGMEQVNFLEKIGVLDEGDAAKITEEMLDNLQDVFDDLGDDLELEGPAQDMFDNFEEVLGKASKQSGPEALAAITSFLDKNPDFMTILKAKSPVLAAAIQGMVDTAAATANAKIGGGQGFMNAILGTGNSETTNKFFGTMEIGKDIGKGGGAGILQPILDKVIEGAKGLREGVKGIDWAEMGAEFRVAILEVFKLMDPLIIGAYIKTNVVDPIFTALGTAFKPEIEAFQKDPVGFILGTANAATINISTFVAGLLNYSSMEAMFDDWERQLVTAFNGIPFLVTLKRFIADPLGGIWDLINGTGIGTDVAGQFNEGEVGAFPDRGFGDKISIASVKQMFMDVIVTPIQEGINSAWLAIKGFAENNPWIGMFLRGDIMGAFSNIWSLIKEASVSVLNQFTSANVFKTLGIYFIDPITEAVDLAASVLQGLMGGHTWLGLLLSGDLMGALVEIYKLFGQTNSAPKKKNIPGLGDLEEPTIPPSPGAGTPTNNKISYGGYGSSGTFDPTFGSSRMESTAGQLWGGKNGPLGHIAESTGAQYAAFTGATLEAYKKARGVEDDRGMYSITPTSLGGGTSPAADARSGMDEFTSQASKNMQPLSAATTTIIEEFKKLVQTAATTATSILNSFSTAFATIGQNAIAMGAAITSVNQVIITGAGTTGASIITSFATATNEVMLLFTALANWWDQAGAVIMTHSQNIAQVMQDVINQGLQNIAGIMTMLAGHWSTQGAAIIATAESAGSVIYEVLNQALQNVAGVMNNLGSHWSNHCNKMGDNAESGADQIFDALDGAMQDIMDSMKDAGSEWSKQCNAMGKNAKSAASQIKNAFDFTVTTIHRIHTIRTGGAATGGLLSFAEGGMMSAAGGKMLTTNGPAYIIGDNPGGRESIWAIPHNNPGPTVRKIEKYHGSGGSGGEGSIWNQNITLEISGNDIINQTKLSKKIKTTVGENRDKFG
jgi:hypothetical protein